MGKSKPKSKNNRGKTRLLIKKKKSKSEMISGRFLGNSKQIFIKGHEIKDIDSKSKECEIVDPRFSLAFPLDGETRFLWLKKTIKKNCFESFVDPHFSRASPLDGETRFCG